MNQNRTLQRYEPEYVVITLGDKYYPETVNSTFGKKPPDKICYKGNLSLLEKKAVGMCGSRKASERGLEVAHDCAEQLADNDIVVISGYAKGIDQIAHKTALEAGGTTIIVLPEGINNFSIRRELRDVWDWNRVLVISHFSADASWQAYRAMDRNKMILALSNAMIVIEAGEKGGTINAGLSALKLNVPLFVCDYDNEVNENIGVGNNILKHKGAHTLRRKRSDHRANVQRIIEETSHAQIYDFDKHNTETQMCLI